MRDVPKGNGKGVSASPTALALGSATAGLLEIGIFHPIDTVAKRLMSHQQRVVMLGGSASGAHAGTTSLLQRLSAVALRDAAGPNTTALRQWISLFPGLSAAVGYKVLQRVYKFGGQPIVNDAVTRVAGERIRRGVGDAMAKPITNALAGSMIGIGEVVLLPLDVLKIKRQTNPEALAGRTTWQVLRSEGLNLYRGAGWTAARNAPGSFALFGGSALAKEYVFGLKNYGDATFMQNLVCSTAGAVSSIVVSNPLDVIKTRIQNKRFDQPVTGMTVVRDLIRDEGPTAFFKGLVPKTAVVAPKLIFAFTAAQWLTSRIDGALKIPAAPVAPRS